ncbi:hypothetical protein [Paucibacter soli]|uniref:hypothetical protein n=1 Tax=Paucibacter soli TaxID=3133433 RepID=UPI0030988F56
MNTPVLFDRAEMLSMLPVTISDLKHAERGRRAPTNGNIRAALYAYVIRELFSKERFFFEESVDGGRGGLFIKGYVRDVWQYLEEAYDLIHGTDFERDFRAQIAPAWLHAAEERPAIDPAVRALLSHLVRRLRNARASLRRAVESKHPDVAIENARGAALEAWNSYQAAKAVVAGA